MSYHRKHHLAWEATDRASGGQYSRYVEDIGRRHPSLTPMENRVAALVHANHPSWTIAEQLGISEETIGNHRIHIRRKMGLQKGEHLDSRLGAY